MSRGEAERAPVVVGIDTAGTASDAVDWAAAEAAARGRALRIVHAFHPPLVVDSCGVVPAVDSYFAARGVAEDALDDAQRRARAVVPDIEVSTRMLQGFAPRVLLDEAQDAEILVVGTRGPCGLRRLLTGSVSAYVVARACCPVVVIDGSGTRTRVERDWSPARVVVGVTDTPDLQPAIGFALRAARQRGIPLAAVHAWLPVDGGEALASEGQEEARQVVERALEPWRAGFARVPVDVVPVCGDAGSALVAESRGAALAVVGMRPRRSVLTGALRSVEHTVLRHAHCPVAIVRDDRGPASRTTRSSVQRRRRSV